MPANTSGWTVTQPSGSSSIRLGDDLIRSDKSILALTLNSEHYFDPVTSASTLSGGVHRAGSARLFFGTRASLATPASDDSAGRLYYSTDLGSLHYLATSSHSTIVGGTKPWGSSSTLVSTACASATTVVIPMVSATSNYDIGGFKSTGSYVVPASLSGTYLLTATVTCPSDVSSGTRILAIRRGAGVVAAQSLGSMSVAIADMSVSWVEQAAAAAYYDVTFYQTSGIALTLALGSFAIQKIG